jgi:hypothetical protein
MSKHLKTHYYMSDDMREFLYVMRVFRTPWIIPVILVALLIHFITSAMFIFLG